MGNSELLCLRVLQKPFSLFFSCGFFFQYWCDFYRVPMNRRAGPTLPLFPLFSLILRGFTCDLHFQKWEETQAVLVQLYWTGQRGQQNWSRWILGLRLFLHSCAPCLAVPVSPERSKADDTALESEQFKSRAAFQLIMTRLLCKVFKYEVHSQQIHCST